MAPRKTAPHPVKRETVEKRPTGTAGSVAALIVAGAAQAGVDISAELAVAIVGVVTAVVSYFNPR